MLTDDSNRVRRRRLRQLWFMLRALRMRLPARQDNPHVTQTAKARMQDDIRALEWALAALDPQREYERAEKQPLPAQDSAVRRQAMNDARILGRYEG